jgi:cytochrome c oxidase accessory protein FixG
MAHLKRLPVLAPIAPAAPGHGSLGTDGRRRSPVPADVRGRFVSARRIVYGGLIVLWAALPWIPIGGHPAVFLDVDRRQFFLFGLTFNAQDAWLLFFALSGVGFGLVYATALLGRVWCGWACPQTVFLEAVFRPIERLVFGPRNAALRIREKGGFARAWRVVATHAAFLASALVIAHVFLAYFVSLPQVFAMVRARPAAHPEAFGWMLVVTGAFYGNFAFFREQLCVVVCPYGRLQSILIDDDSLVVGYDRTRGEPRGKASSKDRGACVDCARCVVVCPTGIDIRDGLQLDCVACTACIDACDEVMDKLGQDRGLVRYDSLRGLRGEARRILRPRIWAYTALMLVGAIVAAVAFRGREPFEANLVRLVGMPYTRESGQLRNSFELHVVNKSPSPALVVVEPAPATDLDFVIPIRSAHVESLGSVRLPVFVTMEATRFTADRPFELRIRTVDEHGGAAAKTARGQFLGVKSNP